MTPSLHSYLSTALWSSIDSNDNSLDRNYDITDFSKEALTQAETDLIEFMKNATELQLIDGDSDLEQIGHDFWLTRNRHGAGFWDGDYPDEIGTALTDIAHSFGELNVEVGDDGKLYFI